MPIITVGESNFAGPIDDDTIVRVKVTGVRFVTQPFKEDDGSDVIRCEFAFLIEDPSIPQDGTRLWGKTPTTFTVHPDCKLHNWAQEIMGQELKAGYDLDTDLLVGMSCRAIVGAREGTDRNGDKKVFNFVKDVLRSSGSHVYAAAEEPF